MSCGLDICASVLSRPLRGGTRLPPLPRSFHIRQAQFRWAAAFSSAHRISLENRLHRNLNRLASSLAEDPFSFPSGTLERKIEYGGWYAESAVEEYGDWDKTWECSGFEIPQRSLLVPWKSSVRLLSDISRSILLQLALGVLVLIWAQNATCSPATLRSLPFASISTSSKLKPKTQAQTTPSSVKETEWSESMDFKLDEAECVVTDVEDSVDQVPRRPARCLLVGDDSIKVERLTAPSTVDPAHRKSLETLQTLSVIGKDTTAEGICTRREFARWMVYASTVFGRSTSDRVFPAVFVEGLSEIAFDDVFPDDEDFPYIQGLAEAGLISSRLSRLDTGQDTRPSDYWFHPDSPLSRQDLVTWKMSLDMKALPRVTGEVVRRVSMFIDVDRIDKEALPSVAYDLSTGDDSIITNAFGYTKRFEPKKAVTHAQAAYVLACGHFAEAVAEEMERRESEKFAEVMEARNEAQMTAMKAMVEEQVASERKMRLDAERQLSEALGKIERMRVAREEEQANMHSVKESILEEREILSKLRSQSESNLAALASARQDIERERERLVELRAAAEANALSLEEAKIQADVERQSMAIAKAWAEEEAYRAREESKQLRALRRRIKSQQIEAMARVGESADFEAVAALNARLNEQASPSASASGQTAASAGSEDEQSGKGSVSIQDTVSDGLTQVAAIASLAYRQLLSLLIRLSSVMALLRSRSVGWIRAEVTKFKSFFHRY